MKNHANECSPCKNRANGCFSLNYIAWVCFLVRVFEEKTVSYSGYFFSSVQRDRSTFCALCTLPYVLSTSFSLHPKPLTWDKKPFQSRRVPFHFFRHYETFLLFSSLWDLPETKKSKKIKKIGFFFNFFPHAGTVEENTWHFEVLLLFVSLRYGTDLDRSRLVSFKQC